MSLRCGICPCSGNAHFRRVYWCRATFRIDQPGRAESLLPWAEIDRTAAVATSGTLRVTLNANDIEARMRSITNWLLR